MARNRRARYRLQSSGCEQPPAGEPGSDGSSGNGGGGPTTRREAESAGVENAVAGREDGGEEPGSGRVDRTVEPAADGDQPHG